MKRQGLVIAASLCGAVAAALLAHALYIPAKAVLAQILLEHAWKRTMNRGAEQRPWPWADTTPIARLTFLSQKQSFVVLRGAHGRSLAFAPAWLEGTAQPGSDGNCVISAHRDTQFRVLRELEPGDAILLSTRNGARHRYVVRRREVIDESRTDILRAGSIPALTLITCYPFDAIRPGGPLRFVVFAERDGSAGEIQPLLSGAPRLTRS